MREERVRERPVAASDGERDKSKQRSARASDGVRERQRAMEQRKARLRATSDDEGEGTSNEVTESETKAASNGAVRGESKSEGKQQAIEGRANDGEGEATSDGVTESKREAASKSERERRVRVGAKHNCRGGRGGWLGYLGSGLWTLTREGGLWAPT